MFGPDFYPTPANVITEMLHGFSIPGKIILEPSAGHGDIVSYLKSNFAKEVICCEIDPDLRRIVSGNARLLANDFLAVRSEDISHIDAIVMNPPFSADEKHILHAYKIAPAGCDIIALCNLATLSNTYTAARQELKALIEQHGSFENLGNAFDTAARSTQVKIGLVRLKKAGAAGSEFDGFFMNEEPEQSHISGLMPYNMVRDLVNRYVGSIKLFDEQLAIGEKVHALTNGYFSGKLSFSCTQAGIPVLRNDFKNDLQKQAWLWVIEKFNLSKYATQGLREDINKFVEKQTHIPFTMKNTYYMVEVILGTVGSRMDKALLEVFNKLTQHYDENRYNVEGWKTNSHYLINEKFIMPRISRVGYSGQIDIESHGDNFVLVADLLKAMCYITGKNHDEVIPLNQFVGYSYKLVSNGKIIAKAGQMGSYEFAVYQDAIKAEWGLKAMADKGVKAEIKEIRAEWGQWFDYEFFSIRIYKKGTCHFKFKDRDTWALLNQNIARILGYPLPESVKRKAA